MTSKNDDEKTLREVSASGSHFQVGVSLGKQCKDMALRMEKRFRGSIAAIPGMTVAKAIAFSKKTLPLTTRFYPEYVEELQGYADGTGLKFDLVYAMVCDYPGLGKKGCTDIAVNSQWTKEDCVYAAHNEDVAPYSISDVAIVRVKPSDEPGFIAVSHGGISPTTGMNNAGISLTGNAVVPNDVRLGIPKDIAVRKVLREQNLFDALKASMPEGRGHSYNNIVCDSNGELYSMEGSATAFDAMYGDDGYLVHTNHYLSPRMWGFEDNLHTRMSSIIRYNRARKLFKRELGHVDIASFKRVLSDHVGYPESICRHPNPAVEVDDQAVTIFSAVFDLTNKALWLCAGHPCVGTYRKYQL
jgi:isopenicillin-N N-acyltransferase-like protein